MQVKALPPTAASVRFDNQMTGVFYGNSAGGGFRFSKKSGFAKSPRIFLSAFLLAFLCLFFPSLLMAATAVSGVKVVDQDEGANTAKIMFNLTNESGVGETGGDWVWIFAKYSKDPGVGTRTWGHCSIATSGHTAGGAATISVPSDKKGAFIEGSGTGMKLVWEYGTDGLTDADVKDADFLIRIFVIDMIKVPGGSFELGEAPGGGQYGCGDISATIHCNFCVYWESPQCSFGQYPASNWYQSPGAFFGASLYDSCCGSAGVLVRTAFTVSSESSVNIGYMDAGGTGSWATGELIYENGVGGDGDGSLTGSFPKGYASFYFMEHELSQGQYRDFLNTLTRTQQDARVHPDADISGDVITNTFVMSNTSSISERNTIRAPASGNGTTAPVVFGCDLDGDGVFDESDDGEWIAMNYLSPGDLLAYADWAGLRPMTELEYEKAGRGSRSAVHPQYPWGDGSSTNDPLEPNTDFSTHCESGGHSALYDGGTVDELVDSNCDGSEDYDFMINWNDQPGYPLRSGAFYGEGRYFQGPATPEGYYGGYDLSGNVQEMVVSVGMSAGRSFDGTHGDGALTAGGEWTNENWSSSGLGLRGGGYADTTTTYFRFGDRSSMGSAATRSSQTGGRLARTTPA